MINNNELLIENAKQIDIDLNENQINQFNKYYEMLIEKNTVMNLTAITEYKDVVIKHFIDSISLIKAYPINDTKEIKVLDIGTGAGFPGIPLKIAFPNINITLLDSLAKRVSFLDEVINTLNLNEAGSIEAVHSRAEDFIKEDNKREEYDLVVSRAVANLSTLSEYCIPYINIGGYFIPYKSEKTDEEIKASGNALKTLGAEIEDIISYSLLGNDEYTRTLIKIKKTHSTPDKYPRKAGLPSKKPLN